MIALVKKDGAETMKVIAFVGRAIFGREAIGIDFNDVIRVILQTFSVLVGISLKDFLDDTKNHLPVDFHTPAFIILVCLLLRYIIGSAIHFNHAYGNQINPTSGTRIGPLSSSTFLFARDLVFLVLFGWLAVRMTHAVKPIQFMQRSGLFLLAGLLWSVLDLIRVRVTDDNSQKPYWALWILLDSVQLAIIIIIVWLYGSTNIESSYVIAEIFIVFLFLDLRGTVRGLQIPHA